MAQNANFNKKIVVIINGVRKCFSCGGVRYAYSYARNKTSLLSTNMYFTTFEFIKCNKRKIKITAI